MHILLTTYGLILVFALFCAAQWRSSEQMSYMDIASTQSFAKVLASQLEDVTDSSIEYYYQLRPQPEKKPADKKKASKEEAVQEEQQEVDEPIEPNDSPKYDMDEPADKGRRTRFLHVYSLFRAEEPDIHQGIGKACFALLKNLLRELYSGQRFYERARDEIPDLEDRFLLELIDKMKALREEHKKEFNSAKHLCNLDLEDELLSYVRYKMLTGNKSLLNGDSIEQPGYYPLIEVITFRESEKLMSLWNAPKALLMALFENEEVVEDVINARKEIYNDLLKDKNKSAVNVKESEMKRRFSTYIHGIDTQFIDFKVSRSYPARSRKPPNSG